MALNRVEKYHLAQRYKSGKDPEYLAYRTIQTIAQKYEKQGIFKEGTAEDHYESNEGKNLLIRPLARAVEEEQNAGRDPEKTLLPNVFLRLPISLLQFWKNFGGDDNRDNPICLFIERGLLPDYGCLKYTPKIPELGQVAALSLSKWGTPSEVHLTNRNRSEQFRKMPGLFKDLREATGREVGHFKLTDEIPQFLGARALDVRDPLEDFEVIHIENYKKYNQAFLSERTGRLVMLSLNYDHPYFQSEKRGVAAVETIK